MILFYIILFTPTNQFELKTIFNDQVGRSLHPVSKCVNINCGEIDRTLELTVGIIPECKVLDNIPIEELIETAYLTHEKNCTVPYLSKCDNNHCVKRNRK